jgi:cell division control protein 6
VWIEGRRGFTPVYVNCGEENTRLRIIRSVLKQLGVSAKDGFPGDYYERQFKEAVSKQRFVILVLDEVDKFTDRKDSESFELFYALSRLVPNVATIMLTNRATFETDFQQTMDARVRDTFRWIRIEFPDYDATQLTDIVEDRCRVGFNPEAYDPGICGLIAALAYNRGGRARGALALAHKSAEIAEARQHSTILEADIREAADRLKQEQGQEIIRMLPPIERKILGFILVNHPTGGMAYNWYVTIAPEHGAGTSLTSFYEYLNKLDTLNLIEKEKHGRGRGRGLEMDLSVPSQIKEAVRFSLELNTPTPTAANVTETNPL